MNKKFKKIITIVILLGILFSVIAFTDLFNTKQAEAGWYSTGGTWGYRKTITINHNQVSGTSDLTNFPMLFSVTRDDLKYTSHGGYVGKTDATDVLFTSADGTTKIDHEIEKYASTTGEYIAWVEIPTLDYDVDTVIYMYYGNSGAADQQNITGVWNVGYKGIYHLLDGTTLSGVDSTSNALNLTITDFVAAAGKVIGGAQDNSTSARMSVASSGALQPTVVTLSAWIYPTSWVGGAGNSPFIVSDTQADPFFYFGTNSLGRIVFKSEWSGGDGLWVTPNSVVSLNAWQHVAVTYDSSSTSNDPVFYLNGAVQTTNETTAPSGTLGTAGTTMNIGNSNINNRVFDGILDEVRFSQGVLSADWIATEYNNQNSPSSFYGIGGADDTVPDTNVKVEANTAWYNGSWGYAKKITVDHTKVSGTANLNDFPVLISLTEADLRTVANGGYGGKDDGTDILFVGENGTKLDHEIEKYASTTGELIAWVRVPVLYPENSTNIIMYFGNAGASDQQNITGTWGSDHKAVYHLPDGTTLGLNDSTVNANTLTNASSQVTAVAGPINGAAGFPDTTTQNITATAANTRVTAFGDKATISFWGYISDPSAGGKSPILIRNTYAGNVFYQIDWNKNYNTEANRKIRFTAMKAYAGLTVTSATKFVIDSWTHFVFTYDGADLKIYQNGVETDTFAYDPTTYFPVSAASGQLVMGQGGNTTTNALKGRLEEVRIVNTNRSADWIATEYANQNATSTFYTISSTLTSSTIGEASTPTTSKVKVRGGVKFR